MRHRREAKTPRRPRVITWRLVLVSLVVAVVLAVTSVPVCDVLVHRSLGQWSEPMHSWRFQEDRYTARVVRSRTWLGDRWWVSAGRDDGPLMRTLPDWGDRPVDTTVDPRPGAIRWPVNAGEREALCFEVGWPLRSASRGYILSIDPLGRDKWGVWKAEVLGREVSFCTRPVWPGLVGNTLFYAILALIPLSLLRRRKLRRRARRGLCLACAYELGEGVEACPECGLSRVV